MSHLALALHLSVGVLEVGNLEDWILTLTLQVDTKQSLPVLQCGEAGREGGGREEEKRSGRMVHMV